MEQIRPKNYLVESILVTIFCCQPFGIVGIVFGSQVNSKYALGDFTGAKEASDNAKKWTTWGFISGIVIMVGVLIFYGSILALAISNEF
jgi:hypothetical protein